MQYRSILIINLGGIGDVLLSTPALRAVKDGNREASLEMLVPERVAPFVRRLPYVDAVHSMTLNYGGLPGQLLSDGVMLFGLRKKRFDLALNMRTLVSPGSAGKMRLMMSLIGAGTTAGRNTDGVGEFFDVRIPETYVGAKYEMMYDIDLVRALGFKTDNFQVDLPVKEQDISGVDAMLEEAGICLSKSIIAVHPGGMPSRRWGEEKFADLIDILAAERELTFIITGSHSERRLGERTAGMVGVPVHNFAGRLDVFGLAALLKRCDLFVCGDTGPMHIAAALETPLVALLGAGDLTRYDPGRLSSRVEVLYNKVDCSPCTRVTCADRKCMRHLTVDSVAEACRRALKME